MQKFPSGGPPRRADLEPVSVLHWNVWDHSNPDQILETVEAADADIVCAHEIARDSSFYPGQDVSSLLMNQLGYNGVFEETHRLRLRGKSNHFVHDGSGIYSRHPLIHVRSETLSEGSWDPGLRGRDLNRKYLEADVQIPGQAELTVGTTHLSLLRAELFDRGLRAREAATLRELVSDKTGRLVVTGDFNARPKRQSVRAISSVLERVDGELDTKTWHLDVRLLGRAASLGMRLDYMFHSRDLDVRDARVLPRGPSDHNPLRAEFVPKRSTKH